MLDRRRFLKRATLWIAAPAIVRVASIMPVKAMTEADEWARALAASQELLDAIRLVPFETKSLENDLIIKWVGSSVFIPAPPPDDATAEEAFTHFLDVTGTRVGRAA